MKAEPRDDAREGQVPALTPRSAIRSQCYRALLLSKYFYCLSQVDLSLAGERFLLSIVMETRSHSKITLLFPD